jgi:hypothetical protein
MKTPREILLARHQAALPKLDALRRDTLETLPQLPSRRPRAPFVHLPTRFWQELILPCRRLWTGLATVWVLIFIVHFSQRDNVNSVTGQPAQPESVVMSLQAQEEYLNAQLADRAAPMEADRPRNFSPKPRTENCETAIL